MTPTIDPVHEALAERIAQQARLAARPDACLIGICGAQGSGKTTLTAILKELLEARALRVATLSLDDFYLSRSEREILGCTVHPLFKTRGVPGTHDISLIHEVLAALRRPGTVALPAFDKARDDRRPEDTWLRLEAPVDVILLEGWCVGARPESAASLVTPINALERQEDAQGIWRHHVNQKLASLYRPVFDLIDVLILLAAPGFEVVHGWRLQQEETLRQRLNSQGGDTGGLMSATEIERFISHYERLTRHILAEMPGRADILVRLDPQRRMTLETLK